MLSSVHNIKIYPLLTLPLTHLLSSWIAFVCDGFFVFMKLIKLTRGLFTQVDDADYDWLNQWKWIAVKQSDNNFYAARASKYKKGVKRESIKMHREILGLKKGDGRIGDHKDLDRLNNQRSNLRIATFSQNCANRKSCGASKYLGVCRADNSWVAQIQVNYKHKYLGCFKTEIDAAKAYNKAAIEYHGEFANLNKL